MRWFGMSLMVMVAVGCGGEGAVGVAGEAHGADSLIEYGVLGFVNGPHATAEVLDLEVALDVRAAKNIAARVRGADGKYGTLDDQPFTSLADLDAVPFVGPSAFDKLIDYVDAIGAMPELELEDVYFTRFEREATLFVVNNATSYELDVEADLDARSVRFILENRPFAYVEDVSTVPFVGTVSLATLRDYAVAYVAWSVVTFE